MEREWLSDELKTGRSIRAIAADAGRDPSTVAYWVNKHSLMSVHSARHAQRGEIEEAQQPDEIVRDCRVHGWTPFRRVGSSGGYRCSRCSTERVARRRRRVKEILLAEAGGVCRLCGYDRYPGALQFHHLDPEAKRFQLAERGVTRALSLVREEARKCVLLCANCHAEVEGGVAVVPARDVPESGPG